jgi:hypothetical protein
MIFIVCFQLQISVKKEKPAIHALFTAQILQNALISGLYHPVYICINNPGQPFFQSYPLRLTKRNEGIK